MTLEVIGAGFGRNATNSLRLALEEPGLGPCHHMFDISENEELLPEWGAIVQGKVAIGTRHSKDTVRKLTGPERAIGGS